MGVKRNCFQSLKRRKKQSVKRQIPKLRKKESFVIKQLQSTDFRLSSRQVQEMSKKLTWRLTWKSKWHHRNRFLNRKWSPVELSVGVSSGLFSTVDLAEKVIAALGRLQFFKVIVQESVVRRQVSGDNYGFVF